MSINLTVTLPLQAISALGRGDEIDPNSIEPDLQKLINYAMKDALRSLAFNITATPLPSPPSLDDPPLTLQYCSELPADMPTGAPNSPLSLRMNTPDVETPRARFLPDSPELDDADLTIGFRDFDGCSHKLKVESTLSIRELVCRLLEEVDVWQHGLILLWSGRVLSPKLTIDSCGLRESDEISLLLDTSDELRHEIRAEQSSRPASVDFTNGSHDAFTFAVKKPEGFALVQACSRTPISDIALYFQSQDGIELATQRWVYNGEPIFDGREHCDHDLLSQCMDAVSIMHGSVVRLVVATHQPLSGWTYT